jgi:hypothetical protein
MQSRYKSPQILDLGSVAELTEGSYPSTPDTLDNVYNQSPMAKKPKKKKAAKKRAKKTAKKTAKKK